MTPWLRIALCVLAACGAELPPSIRAEMAKSPPGVTTIVMFTDFQCPYCRRTHAALAPMLEERRARIVLRHVPLSQHPDARAAASASICVETLAPEKTYDYAHALFTTSDLDASLEELAIARGVDRDRFRACVVAPATAERIAHDGALFDEVHGDGVPLLFVGTTRLEGAQSPGMLRSALEK